MNFFYHNWVYEHVLNTAWFLWIFVGGVLALNFGGPIIIWYLMTGKGRSKKKEKEKEKPSMN